jgi:hypothetical protein
MRKLVVVLAAAVGLAGCSTSTPSPLVDGEPPAHPYDGPMRVMVSEARHASVLESSGAAGQALECDSRPYAGGTAFYDSGLESVQDSAASALGNYFREEGVQLPREGYRVERSDGDRVLLSYDVSGRSKITFIVADTILDFNGDRGWGVETWAQCDPSELPADVTDALDIQVWRGTDGARVPVTTIQSFQGAEHCDWQDITFLMLGHGRDAVEYVRDTTGTLSRSLVTTYAADTPLPESATDAGFSRDGRRLWLAADGDAAYLVADQGAGHAERWPAAKQLIGCA